jgi:hypothetical protein
VGGVFPLLVISETMGNITLYTPNLMQNNSFTIYAPLKIVNTKDCEVIGYSQDLVSAIWVFTEYVAGLCEWEGLGPAVRVVNRTRTTLKDVSLRG